MFILFILLYVCRDSPDILGSDQSKSGWVEMGATEHFLRPHPLERRKRPLLENTSFFQLIPFKQSASDKIMAILKID